MEAKQSWQKKVGESASGAEQKGRTCTYVGLREFCWTQPEAQVVKLQMHASVDLLVRIVVEYDGRRREKLFDSWPTGRLLR